MRQSTLVVATIGLLTATPSAQTPATPGAVSFEAASIKTNKSGDSNTSLRPQPGGRFSATNAPVQLLITYAYQLQPFQLQGAPNWLRTDRFDIVARMEGDPPVLPAAGEQVTPTMLAVRTLLADRFKLAVHGDTQELPIYELVVARQDGKLGPNIRPSSVDCAAMSAASAAAAKEGRVVTVNTPDRVSCGMRNSGGRIQFGGNSLSFFATAIANQVGRTVVDRTGLSGNWDFEFTFTPERFRQQALTGAATPDVDANGPSLFTAIQEQLGLKLESTKGPVQVLVIDHIEQPSPD